MADNKHIGTIKMTANGSAPYILYHIQTLLREDQAQEAQQWLEKLPAKVVVPVFDVVITLAVAVAAALPAKVIFCVPVMNRLVVAKASAFGMVIDNPAAAGAFA